MDIDHQGVVDDKCLLRRKLGDLEIEDVVESGGCGDVLIELSRRDALGLVVAAIKWNRRGQGYIEEWADDLV